MEEELHYQGMFAPPKILAELRHWLGAVDGVGALVVGGEGRELGGVVRGGVVVLDDGGGGVSHDCSKLPHGGTAAAAERVATGGAE